MDVVFHILGFCSDSHSHLDLIDLFIYSTSTLSIGWIYIKNIFNVFKKNNIKNE